MKCDTRGFTLIELSIAMVVIGILATVALIRYNATVAYDELEKASFNMYRELVSVRSLALKNDCSVFVRFAASRCSVFVDFNENGVADSGEYSRSYTLPHTVKIGVAANGPNSGPTGIAFENSGIAGQWNTKMIVSNNATSTINAGAIYLCTSRLKKRTFCVGLSISMQSVKFYAWDGAQWGVK